MGCAKGFEFSGRVWSSMTLHETAPSNTPPPAPAPQGEGENNRNRIPMILTWSRIAAGPVIAGLVLWAAALAFADRESAALIYLCATALFVLAALTDWLDGQLARGMGATSDLGAALDHAADKVLCGCVLVALAYSALTLELTIAATLLLGRDIGVAGLREGLAKTGQAPKVGAAGKWKAAIAMAAIAAILAQQAAGLSGGAEALFVFLGWAGRALLWLATALSLWSGVIYFRAALSAKD